MRGLGEDSPSKGLMVCAGALALLYGIVVFAKVKPNTKKRAPLGSFWASLQSTPPAPRPKRRRRRRLTREERDEMLAEQDLDEWSRSARRREERDELSVGRRSVGRNRRRISRNGVRGYILTGRNRGRDADPFSRMTRADQAAFDKTYSSLPSASSAADRLSDRYGDDISFDVKALVSRGGR